MCTAGDGRAGSRSRLLLLLLCSRQVVLQAVELAAVLLPFAAAAVMLGRRRVVDVKWLLVLQAGLQGVLQLVGSTGVILPGEMEGSGDDHDMGDTAAMEGVWQ